MFLGTLVLVFISDELNVLVSWKIIAFKILIEDNNEDDDRWKVRIDLGPG